MEQPWSSSIASTGQDQTFSTLISGELEDLQEVYSSYGVYREKNQISDSAAGYLINHTSRINIIDTQGRWQLSFSHDAPVEDLVHDIRLLLKNPKS